ncbi:MAG: hypothetical protein PHF17_11350 [Arcobacteraceae bacterium]|jgi:hypothetical protein|nr:hypothetical protein [Arcobacteraceae bacterium]
MKISSILEIFVAINIVASIVAMILFGFDVVVNLQVAFFSSFFIVLGSFIGYRKNILKQSEDFIVKDENDRDVIDAIDDKFDLYGEINENELSDEDVKEIIKEERSKQNIKDSLTNTMKSFKATTSIYRIAGYVLLVVGFFFLNNNQLLIPIAYLAGFLVIPIMALIVNLKYIKS